MLGSADPHEVKGKDYTVRQLLDDFDRDLPRRLGDDPEVEAAVRTTMGIAYTSLGLYDKAEPHLTKAIEVGAEDDKRDAIERIVKLYDAWGKPDQAAEWKARLSK